MCVSQYQMQAIMKIFFTKRQKSYICISLIIISAVVKSGRRMFVLLLTTLEKLIRLTVHYSTVQYSRVQTRGKFLFT